METAYALDHFDDYNFEGALMRIPDVGVVAFTAGERSSAIRSMSI